MGMLSDWVRDEALQEAQKKIDKALGFKYLVEHHPDPGVKGQSMEALIGASKQGKKIGPNLLPIVMQMAGGMGQGPSGGTPAEGRPTPETVNVTKPRPSSVEGMPAPSPDLPLRRVGLPGVEVGPTETEPMPVPSELGPQPLPELQRLVEPMARQATMMPYSISPQERERAAQVRPMEPTAPDVPSQAMPPRQPGFWGKLGQVALSGLEGALTQGQSVQEAYRAQEQERAARIQMAAQERQARLGSQLRMEEQRQAQAWEISPERFAAIRANAIQQLTDKGIIDQIEQGRMITRMENDVQEMVRRGTPIEDAYRFVMPRYGMTYHVPPIERFSREVERDPTSPTGYSHVWVDPMTGQKRTMGPAPPPAAEQLRPGRDIPYPPKVEEQRIAERTAVVRAAQTVASTGLVLTARPDPTTGNIVDPGTGLTPNAIWQGGKLYALTGRMPPMGLGSRGAAMAARESIVNTASALAATVGTDVPTLQALYKANQVALDKMLPLYTATETFAQNAQGYFDLLRQAGERMDQEAWRVAVPAIDAWVRTGQVALTGNAAVNNYLGQLQIALTEYAKVVTGQTTGAAVTDRARAEVSNLLRSGLSTATVNDFIDKVAQPEMARRTHDFVSQIYNISSLLGSFLDPGYTPSTPSVSAADPFASLPRPKNLGDLVPGAVVRQYFDAAGRDMQRAIDALKRAGWKPPQ